MGKNPLWLPGWGLLPAIAPACDFNGRALQVLNPWPGYQEGAFEKNLDEAWTRNALIEWLDHQIHHYGNGEPVELVGWSMGGLLALCYADHFPGRIKQLTLWGSTARFKASGDWPGQPEAAIGTLREALRAQDVQALERFLKSQIPASASFREARRHLMTYSKQTPWPQWDALKLSLEWLVNEDIRERLAYIDIPVAVYHGTEDVIIPFEAGRQLAHALPNATLHPCNGRGHALWLLPA